MKNVTPTHDAHGFADRGLCDLPSTSELPPCMCVVRGDLPAAGYVHELFLESHAKMFEVDLRAAVFAQR
eukprot:357499-Chlamydomonas_euryale.AAC.9